VLDNLEDIFAETIPPPTADPLERLGKFFLNRIKVVTGQPGIQSLVFSDQLIHAGGKDGLKRVTNLRRKGREYIQSCLLEASKKQLIRPELDLDDILILFHGTVMGLISLSKQNFLEGSIEDRTRRVWKTFLSMIRR